MCASYDYVYFTDLKKCLNQEGTPKYTKNMENEIEK